jgi:hypothetical protein
MLTQVTVFGIITTDLAVLELLIFIRTSPNPFAPQPHHHLFNAKLTSGSAFGHHLGSPHRFRYFHLQRSPPGIAHHGFRPGIPFWRLRSRRYIHLAPPRGICGETCGIVGRENSSATDAGDLFLGKDTSYLHINRIYC